MDIGSPQPTEKIVAEVCLKRHHSASYEGTEGRKPAKRAKMAMEVGVNGETPPHLSGFHNDDDDDDIDNGEDDNGDSPDRDSTTPSFSSTEDRGHLSAGGNGTRHRRRRRQSSGDSSGLQAIAGPTSFFGSHQPLSPNKSPSRMTGKVEFKPISLAPTVGRIILSPAKRKIDLSSTILSQFSDEKFKDLASAVSKITNTPPPPIHSSRTHIISGSHIASHMSVPAVSIPNAPKHTAAPDYGANTPPPEDVVQGSDNLNFLSQDRLPRVASGPPFPQHIEMVGDQPAAIPAPIPPQSSHLGTASSHLETALGSVGKEQYQNQTVTSLQLQSNKERNRDRERFANTPPPDYQPLFNKPQAPTTHQQTQLQASRYHRNNVNNVSEVGQAYPQQHQHVVEPRTYYNNNSSYSQQHEPRGQQHQGGWEHQQQQEEGETPHDPRRHSHGAEEHSNFSHGDGGRHIQFPLDGGGRGSGNNYLRGSYSQQHNKRDGGHEKKYMSGVGKQYPAEWYRK